MIRQPINIPTGNKEYQLLEEYVCPLSGTIVEKGFTYDGASVPRAMWTLTGIRPDGLYRAGATVHDKLYRNRGRVRIRVRGIDEWATFSRSDADNIFRCLVAASGVWCYRAWLAWSGLRLFGWAAWIKKK